MKINLVCPKCGNDEILQTTMYYQILCFNIDENGEKDFEEGKITKGNKTISCNNSNCGWNGDEDDLIPANKMKQTIVKHGIYEYYKGGKYVVKDIADFSCCTPTTEKAIIYHELDGYKKYVKPYSEFAEFVFKNNKYIPRFKKIG